MNSNPVGWFEIPVLNMDRAMEFYEYVLEIEMTRMKLDQIDMAWFPSDAQSHGSAGSLVFNEEFYEPSQTGVLLYLSCKDVSLALDRAVEKGGTLVLAKKAISEDHGFMGIMLDIEGNRIALHNI